MIAQLVRNDGLVTFEGRCYKLRNARLQARPQRPIPILIGGNGPKRTLPIVAKYADIRNYQFASLEVLKERSTMLDTLLLQAGRMPGDVKCTLFLPVFCWRDKREMESIATRFNEVIPSLAGLSAEQVFEWWTSNTAAVTGLPNSVVEQLRAYEVAGADELYVTMFGTSKGDHLDSLATHVLPHFRS